MLADRLRHWVAIAPSAPVELAGPRGSAHLKRAGDRGIRAADGDVWCGAAPPYLGRYIVRGQSWPVSEIVEKLAARDKAGVALTESFQLGVDAESCNL